jgi:hypothetical protein
MVVTCQYWCYEEVLCYSCHPALFRYGNRKRLRWHGHVARTGGTKNIYRIMAGKPLGKYLLGRPKISWEDNIEIYYMEIRCEGGEWMKLPWDCVRGQSQQEVVTAGSGWDFNGEYSLLRVRLRSKTARVPHFIVQYLETPGLVTVPFMLSVSLRDVSTFCSMRGPHFRHMWRWKRPTNRCDLRRCWIPS